MKTKLLFPVVKLCEILIPGLYFEQSFLTPGYSSNYTSSDTAEHFSMIHGDVHTRLFKSLPPEPTIQLI